MIQVSENKLKRSMSIAKLMVNFVLIFTIIIMLFFAFNAIFQSNEFMASLRESYSIDVISRGQFILFVLYFNLGVLPFFLSAWFLRGVLLELTKPIIEMQRVIRLAKRTALSLWIAIFLSIFGDTISNLILIERNSGRLFFNFDFGMTDILAILAAIMAGVMVNALRLGLNLWNENKKFI